MNWLQMFVYLSFSESGPVYPVYKARPSKPVDDRDLRELECLGAALKRHNFQQEAGPSGQDDFLFRYFYGIE
jgi:hypothetical protein